MASTMVFVLLFGEMLPAVISIVPSQVSSKKKTEN